MAQENTVSFKVFLQGDEANKPEVRRFGIDRDVVSNFSYLVEKLKTVFPALHDKHFNVSWKDSDGDYVLISSDDELMIALTEMASHSEVSKLYITVNGKTTKDNSSKRTGTAHTNVVCDECESDVCGFRYKCIQCRNYDLCADCEAKGLHAEHIMIRLPFPVLWRPNLGKHLAHYLSKSARRCPSAGGAEEATSGGEAEQCPFTRPHGRHGHRHHHGGHRAMAQPFLDALNCYFSEWLNIPSMDREEAGGEQAGNGCTEEKKTQTTNEGAQTKDNAGPSSGSASSGSTRQDANVNYLLNVGKAVASILDPLGIDVHVNVESNEAKGQTAKCPEKLATKNVSFAEEPEKDKENAEPAKQETEKKEKDKRQKDRDESPTSEGWTVVNQDEASAQETNTEASSHEIPIVREDEEKGNFLAGAAAAAAAAAPPGEPDIMKTTEAAGKAKGNIVENKDENIDAPVSDSEKTRQLRKQYDDHLKAVAAHAHTVAANAASAAASVLGLNAGAATGAATGAYPKITPIFSHTVPISYPPTWFYSNPPLPPPPTSTESPAYQQMRYQQLQQYQLQQQQLQQQQQAQQQQQLQQQQQAQQQPPQPQHQQQPPQSQQPQQPQQPPQQQQQQQQPRADSFLPHYPRVKPNSKGDKIARALDDMLAMGFNNEGGWLVQLLQMKDGDIDKVLDALQPVKKA